MASRISAAAPTLRALLAKSVTVDEDPYDDARRYAMRLIGSAASHIRWTTIALPDGSTGIAGDLLDPITGDLLALLYEQYEPGNEQLYVRIPCPQQPDICHWAYDTVDSVGDLVAILDGADDTDTDPHCLRHTN